MNAIFKLHPQLAADTHEVGELPLSRLLLMDDVRYPWLILVPREPGMRDWIDLPSAQQHQLFDEVDLCGRALRHLYVCDKLNIAALGNVVAQLHVHVVARTAGDAVWPRPVWGAGERTPYAPADATEQLNRLRAQIGVALA